MKIKSILRVMVAVGLLLLIPVWGNSNIDGWNWTAFDFVWATVVLSSAGFAFEYVLSQSSSMMYKVAGGLAVMATLCLVWVNAAVGIIGENNPVGMLYLGIPLIGLVGAFISHLKPYGMMRTLFTMAFVQMMIPVIALVVSPANFAPGVLHVFMLNAVFAMLFVASGLLFREVDENK